ncbi:Aurkb [Symbiodinium natans]|uniref:Aurkb protein n=1 Tax=Symbiodinium natans TaxID=878477 RepID=A0A812TPM5_9DINO|nr:Aurkb [Symbiodinium natans]
MDVGSRTVVVKQLVALDPQSCYDAFLRKVWKEGAGLGTPQILEEGDPETGVDCVRQVALGIVEHILQGQRGDHLEYVIEAGPWPTSYNRARVDFVEESQGGTCVTWTSNFTPSLFGSGPLLSFTIRTSFQTMLRSLAA